MKAKTLIAHQSDETGGQQATNTKKDLTPNKMSQGQSIPFALKKKLLLYYNFETADNNKVPAIVGKHDGVLVGAQIMDKGKIGSACEFASHKSMDISGLRVPDDFTIALWVNPYAINLSQCFIGKHTSSGGNVFLFGYWSEGYHVRIRNATHTEPGARTGWQHLVVTGIAKGGKTDVVIYRDGVKIVDVTLDAILSDGSGRDWTLGQEWDENTRTDFLRGAIDDLMIFKDALSENEVKQLFGIY